jgi:HPt (histidine-containing phosphotransfer) domain-containing protein
MKECCKAFLNEQFDGDQDVVVEIYVEYVSSTGEKLAEIEKATASADWTAVDKLAHAVKGNALAVGDHDVVETAIALRGAATLGDSAQAAGLVARLKQLAAEL